MHPDSSSSAPHAEVLVLHDAPAAPAGGAPSGTSALIGQLPLLAAIVAIFYFLVIRPQNQERKKHEELLASLKKDDEVVTQGGLFGRITRVENGRIEVEISPKVRVWMEASSVKRREALGVVVDPSKGSPA